MPKEKISIVKDLTSDEMEESFLACMEGPPGPSCAAPSVSGNCFLCWKEIHYSLAAPKIKKVCRACMMKDIDKKGKLPEIKITETTLKEVMKSLGLEDTPEAREEIISRSTEGFVKWLKEGRGEDGKGKGE